LLKNLKIFEYRSTWTIDLLQNQMKKNQKYSIVVAGSTHKTRQCAQALAVANDLEIVGVITPAPKPQGRKKELVATPMQTWAEQNQLPTILINKKIDDEVKTQLMQWPQPNFLLVVDFGYLVPPWLLAWPQIMPLNVHPSLLPRWRGSSPGQFVLLNGEKDSAVSIIKVNEKLDQGPILWQEKFAVGSSWTQTEYYAHSFELASQNLAQVMRDIADGKVTPQPQPIASPTPIATRIAKDEAYFEWAAVKQAMSTSQLENDQLTPTQSTFTQPTLTPKQPTSTQITHQTKLTQPSLANSCLTPTKIAQRTKLAQQIERASRAYSPWPLAWTIIPTAKGQRRMQLLETSLSKNGVLLLKTIKIEGMSAKPWSEVKSVISHQK
jgi:methionyl-tRNA formyltransferase